MKKNQNIHFLAYRPLFLAEVGPRLSDHFRELPLPVRIHRFERGVFFSEEEVVTAPVWFRAAGVSSPSSPSPVPPSRIERLRVEWDQGSARLVSCNGRGSLVWVVENPIQNLGTHFHRHQIATVEFPIDCSGSWKSRLKRRYVKFKYKNILKKPNASSIFAK